MGRSTSIRAVALGFALAAGLGGAAACSGTGSGEARSGQPRDGGAVGPVVAPVELAVRPLGCAGLDAYGWRRGPGRDGFARALAAEKRGDLPTIEREAAAALAADPGHLEAAWLVAVARARQGKLDGVLAPLEIAAAGDWAKWGERSLELEAFAAWRATPTGQAWVRAADRYRAALAGALGGAVVVVGRTAPSRLPRGETETRVEHRAELYGVDLAGGRWLRLTRTGGAVVGAVPAPNRPLVAYAAYHEVERKSGKLAIRELRVGVVDLATGRAGREIAVPDVAELTLGWAVRGAEPVLVARVVPLRTAGSAAPRTYALDWRQGQKRGTDLPPPRDGLRVRPLAAERRRLPVAGVTADWDDTGTASAVRIEKSKKVVAPGGASGAMIDGHSLVWSPDGARLAFATAAEDPCGQGAAKDVAVYVVDAASGRARVVGKGAGVPSPAWLDAARLAFVDGDGVRVIDAASGKELARLDGGGGVVTGALGESRACASATDGPFATDTPPDDGTWDDEAADEPGAADGDAATAAGPAADAGTPSLPPPP